MSVNQSTNNGKTIFSRNDYRVLFELYKGECFTELQSLPVKAIADEVKLSTNKVRQALKSFISVGYVEEGATIHRAKTYYVTQKGIEKIEEIFVEKESEKEENEVKEV